MHGHSKKRLLIVYRMCYPTSSFPNRVLFFSSLLIGNDAFFPAPRLVCKRLSIKPNRNQDRRQDLLLAAQAKAIPSAPGTYTMLLDRRVQWRRETVSWGPIGSDRIGSAISRYACMHTYMHAVRPSVRPSIWFGHNMSAGMTDLVLTRVVVKRVRRRRRAASLSLSCTTTTTTS